MADTQFTDAALADSLRGAGSKPLNEAHAEKLVAERASLKASEIALVRTRLGATANGHIERAANKLIAAGTNAMSGPDYEAFSRSVTHAARAAQLDGVLADLEERFAQSGGLRITEPRTYAPDSPHSWYRDYMAGFDGGGFGVDTGAQERMARYNIEVAYEVRRGSPEG